MVFLTFIVVISVFLIAISIVLIAQYLIMMNRSQLNKQLLKEASGRMLPNIKQYVIMNKIRLKKEIEYFCGENPPSLAIIQVGAVEASNRYIRNKIQDCKEVGINAHHYAYGEEITEDEFLLEVKDLCEHYTGVIVQLPLPDHIDAAKVTAAIDPIKDVDGFHPLSPYKPATPLGIMNYLQDNEIELDGKHVVIIGRSEIVGKPLAAMMTSANATVTLCHSHTKHLSSIIQQADLIVSAVGKPKFLNCYSIHVPVIDVGINFDENGHMCGDCFNTEDRDVTPVPGGVGLLTRLALLENVFKAQVLQSGR